MKIGILGAMQEEIDSLLPHMKNVTTSTRAGTIIHEGTINDKKVCLVKCGIGKVASAAVTQLLISEFGITHAINTGLAGGIKKGIKVGDIVISTYTEFFDITPSVVEGNFPNKGIYHADKDLFLAAVTASDKLALNDITHQGHITTGDQFITQTAQKQELVSRTTAWCKEMEGGAIAQVCYINKLGFLIDRIISDLADDTANDTYYDFKDKAPKLCNDVILKLLELL